MHDANALAAVLREIHTQIIRLADGVQQLATSLEAEDRRRNSTPRFLSEEQFAEFLGTTVAALRTRRFRKQIPENIWVKEGRRTLYSVEAYEHWIEARLQISMPCQQLREGKRIPKPGQGKRSYPLLV